MEAQILAQAQQMRAAIPFDFAVTGKRMPAGTYKVETLSSTGGHVVVSLRGGDFLLESGQDLSLGYTSHDVDSVHLYLEESFSFRVATPEAAVALSS
mgnify:CR=1 FL=1